MKFSSIPLQLQGVLVLIALFSFAISYNNLHDMALEMGIPHYLAWFFPFCIDAFLLACSIFILYAEEKGINPVEGWVFLLTYTALSIIFNVIHSPDVFWYQVGYSACPISLCISLHLFVKVTKHEMIHDEVKEDIDKIDEESEFKMQPLQPYHEVEFPFKSEPCDLSGIKIEPEPELTEQQKKVLDVFKSESDISMAEAGRRLDMSYKTVKKYKDQLIEMGML